MHKKVLRQGNRRPSLRIDLDLIKRIEPWGTIQTGMCSILCYTVLTVATTTHNAAPQDILVKTIFIGVALFVPVTDAQSVAGR
jgi:hypothetical protein